MDVKNNLEEHLSIFKTTVTPKQRLSESSESSKKKFTFKRRSSEGPPASTSAKKHFLPCNTTNVKCLTKPTATVAPVTIVPQPSRLIPVTPTSSSHKTMVPLMKDISSVNVPVCSPAKPIDNYQQVHYQQINDDSEALLTELQKKRLHIMDDICEVLNEVPSNTLSSLFGPSAGFIQKRLAMRRKVLSQEAAIERSHCTIILSPEPHPLQSCDSHVTNVDEHLFDEWNEIIDDDDVPRSTLAVQSDTRPFDNTRSVTMSPTNSFNTRPSINTTPSINNTRSSISNTTPSINNTTPSICNTRSSINNTSSSINNARPSISNTTPSINNARPSINNASPHNSVCKNDNSSEFSCHYPHSSNLVNIFRNVFGLRQFRPKQLEAINAAILSQDCFVLMPTGGGKSLCYQLPALVVSGVTIVISPLRSLIQDQVQKLNSLEIPACHLSGEMNQSDELRVYTELSIKEPRIRLLYVTPEKLVASQKLVSALQALFTRQKLSRFVVDEAHCISSWGHDFRPDYKKLCQLRTKFPNIPLMALTATATPRVQADILHQLNMSDTKWFTQSFNRTNLVYSVVQKKPKKVTEDIIAIINSKFRNQSGIIYCLSRRDCEVVSDELNRAGIPSVAYHAGLQGEERSSVQNRWLRDSHCKVVCATIAFGMGIDKPDVRFVIHHTIAKSIEGYYQESGRAGRDGRPAHCVLYYNYGDMSRIRRLLMTEDNRSNLRQNMDNLFRIVQYCENESDCRRLQLLEYFAEQFNDQLCKTSQTPCDNCQSSIPHSTQDVTELVEMIVQSIKRIPARDQYTLVQHLEALRGTNATRPSLLSLPYYKRGVVLSKHDLERLLHMMVLNNILGEELHVGIHGNVISYVKLGRDAESVLNGSYGTILLKVKNKAVTAGTSNIIGSSCEGEKLKEECYQELKKLRTSIAVDNGRNPEVIIAITTLQDMAQKLPRNKTEMLTVQGMTEAKWKNSNGQDFLAVTYKYSVNLEQQSNNNNNTENTIGNRQRKRSKGTVGLKRKDSTQLATPIATSYDSEDEFDNNRPTAAKKRATATTTTTSKQTRLPGYLTIQRKQQ